jgi:hypothetical protein
MQVSTASRWAGRFDSARGGGGAGAGSSRAGSGAGSSLRVLPNGSQLKATRS